MWNVVFSTALVYFFYLQIGGCLFLFLESINHLGMRVLEDKNVSMNFTDMSFILLQNGLSEEDIDHTVTAWSENFYIQYFENEAELPSEISWTYHNAFFFAFHLCSTIGYGDISPKTAYGQMLAVLYATIGIPLHILFFKLLGESFAQSYQETAWMIRGEDQSKKMKILGDLGFFIPWSIMFFILPSAVFMFTENWNLIEGIYYSVITLTTVGLGDYIAGSHLGQGDVVFFIYKLLLLCWMLYGLAFTSMLVDVFTHRYQMHLLWVIKCDCKERVLKIQRIYIDVEKLDVHFRLLRTQGAKHRLNLWAIRKDTQKAVDFQMNHLGNLATVAESVQLEILKHLNETGTSRQDAFPVRSD